MNFEIGNLPYTYTSSAIAFEGGLSDSSDVIIDHLKEDGFAKALRGPSSKQSLIYKEQFRKKASQCKLEISRLQEMLISKEEMSVQTNELQLQRTMAHLYENGSRDRECMQQVEVGRADLASRIRNWTGPSSQAEPLAIPERRPALELSSLVPSIFADDSPAAPVPAFLQQLGRDSIAYRRTRVEQGMVAANMLASAVSGAGHVTNAVVRAACERNESTKRVCKVAGKIASGIAEPIIQTGKAVLKKTGAQEVIDHVHSSWVYTSQHHLPEHYEKELGIPREQTVRFVQSTETLAEAAAFSAIGGAAGKVTSSALSQSKVMISWKRARKVEIRSQALMQGDPGVTFVPLSNAIQHVHQRSRGIGGTFVTDLSEFEQALGKLPVKENQIVISAKKARNLERRLGLNEGAALDGGVISVIEDVHLRNPRIPLEGNSHFLGAGKGLPKGGPEIEISPIRNTGGGGIRQIDLIVKKSTEGKKAQARRLLSNSRGNPNQSS